MSYASVRWPACRCLLSCSVLLLLAVPLVAQAEDEEAWGAEGDDEGAWGEEEDEAGFADAPAPVVKAAPQIAAPWSLKGFVRSDLGLWTERFETNPLAKARQSLDLAFRYKQGGFRVLAEVHGEYDAAYLYERDSYDAAQLDAYELRLLHGEQYVAADLGDFAFTVGRQIVAWGEGDAISPLDIVNPRDMREPGLADLDDLRLGILATRVGWFSGAHRLEAMVVHEAYFGERAPPMGEFSALPALLAEQQALLQALGDKTFRYRDVQPRFGLDQQGYLLRWVYKGSGVDLGLYAASVLDRQGVIQLPDAASFLTDDQIEILLDHPRSTILGHSGATNLSSLLLKWELMLEPDKSFNVGDPGAFPPTLDVAVGSLATGMLGLSYSGISDTTLGLELSKALLIEAPEQPLFPMEEPTIALRISHSALRERLMLNAGASIMGWTAELGWVARAEVSYLLRDALRVGLGYVTYQPGSGQTVSPLMGLDSHDRLFFKLRWDFVVD